MTRKDISFGKWSVSVSPVFACIAKDSKLLGMTLGNRRCIQRAKHKQVLSGYLAFFRSLQCWNSATHPCLHTSVKDFLIKIFTGLRAGRALRGLAEPVHPSARSHPLDAGQVSLQCHLKPLLFTFHRLWLRVWLAAQRRKLAVADRLPRNCLPGLKRGDWRFYGLSGVLNFTERAGRAPCKRCGLLPLGQEDSKLFRVMLKKERLFSPGIGTFSQCEKPVGRSDFGEVGQRESSSGCRVTMMCSSLQVFRKSHLVCKAQGSSSVQTFSFAHCFFPDVGFRFASSCSALLNHIVRDSSLRRILCAVFLWLLLGGNMLYVQGRDEKFRDAIRSHDNIEDVLVFLSDFFFRRWLTDFETRPSYQAFYSTFQGVLGRTTRHHCFSQHCFLKTHSAACRLNSHSTDCRWGTHSAYKTKQMT